MEAKKMWGKAVIRVILACVLILPVIISTAGADYIVFDNSEPLLYSSGNGLLDRLHAEDFTLTENVSLTKGHFWTLEGQLWDGTLEYFIFADDGGTPGSIISSGDGQNVVKNATGRTPPAGGEYAYSFEFETPIDLDTGETYWFGLHLAADYDGNWYGITWSDATAGLGYTCYESLGGTMDNWVDSSIHRAFYLEGVPEPGMFFLFSMGVMILMGKRRKRT